MSENKSDASVVLRFKVSVSQVRTMADGGLRFVFDAPETDIDTAAALMHVKQAGGLLEIAAVPVLQGFTNGKKQTNQRTKTSPIDMARG